MIDGMFGGIMIFAQEGPVSFGSAVSFCLFLSITMVVYYLGLFAVINATRQSLFQYTHPSRAFFAAFLVVASIIYPVFLDFCFYWNNLAFPQDQLVIYRIDPESPDAPEAVVSKLAPASKEVWQEYQGHVSVDENRREQEILAEIEKIKDDLREIEASITPEERAEWEQTLNFFENAANEQRNVLPREIRVFEQPSLIPLRPDSFVPKFIMSFLMTGIPGMILGFGYVSKIRKQPERPGYIAGIFSIVAWPLIILFGLSIAAVVYLGPGVYIMIVLALISAGFLIGKLLAPTRNNN